MDMLEFFFINIKPSNVNSSHRIVFNKRTRKPCYVPIEGTIDFKDRIYGQTLRQSKNINIFEENFDINESYLKATYVFLIPRTKLFTKKGYISKKSGDLDNFPKSLQDAIFKAFNKLDDCVICKIDETKVASYDSNYHIYVKLEKKDLDDLEVDMVPGHLKGS